MISNSIFAHSNSKRIFKKYVSQPFCIAIFVNGLIAMIYKINVSQLVNYRLKVNLRQEGKALEKYSLSSLCNLLNIAKVTQE
ncbi:hypothetical protein N473_12175 [Pseudoalteromonas luteoviolacea CPMOR-1]|uniref:Uncharacterized protein n=1 Tax=Pseudoalteromonas luteoviolacea CPMOR-1 TaxID=1365248 RepID=A0A167M462_9GAMM|nr:hypothetical protein N473_12175 [Pseudoalteromonas luteoviolacea CPMOR-1]